MNGVSERMNECTDTGALGCIGKPANSTESKNGGRPPAASPGSIQGGQKGLGPWHFPGVFPFEPCHQRGHRRRKGRVFGIWPSRFLRFLTKGLRGPVTSSVKENSRTKKKELFQRALRGSKLLPTSPLQTREVGLGPQGDISITKPELHKEQLPELQFKELSLPFPDRLARKNCWEIRPAYVQ